MPADEVRSSLHEDPALPGAARLQRARELAAPLGMVPEEIVGDEDAVADGREVVQHRADRPLTERAIVELPHRTEVAAERASARRLDQPDGLEEETVVAIPVAIHEIARRQRNPVKGRAFGQRRRRDPSVRSPQPQSRNRRERPPVFESREERRDDLLSVVHADRVHLVALERLRERGRRVTADENERARRQSADLPRLLEQPVVLERVHPGETDDPWPRLPDRAAEPTSEPEIHDRRFVSRPPQRGADVFEAERLDAEERSQSEALVARVGPDEEDVHSNANCIVRGQCRRSRRCGRGRSG